MVLVSPKTNYVDHYILTADEKPIYYRQTTQVSSSTPEGSRRTNRETTTEGCNHTFSTLNSPLWIIPKRPGPDGKVAHHNILDYRKLNEMLIRLKHPRYSAKYWESEIFSCIWPRKRLSPGWSPFSRPRIQGSLPHTVTSIFCVFADIAYLINKLLKKGSGFH